MNRWIEVGTVDDLQPDSGVCALVDGQQVALFYLRRLQQIYALGNYDPIGKANVISRGLIGDLNGEPMVASPLYKQHYSLTSGRCFENAAISLPTYPVRIEHKRILVGLSQ